VHLELTLDVCKDARDDLAEFFEGPDTHAHRQKITEENIGYIQHRLSRELGVFAIFWSFNQSFVGDHGGIFERFEYVWREMEF
jgi:hypothetical protein